MIYCSRLEFIPKSCSWCGNDAHIAFRVAGDKARRRAEDLLGMGGNPPLLPQRANMEEAGIGHDQAQEPAKPNKNKQT